MPPPKRVRYARACAMTLAGPHSTEPTGAPRPFDRQNMTVSAAATSCRGSVPNATAAFQIRAPSTCTRNPPARAIPQRIAISPASIGAPDNAMYVFSMTSNDGCGKW